jgi:hypothetical protein
MRRPLRNIEIFSMSVLDMFASALGCFIIISVLLFPYYNQERILERTKEEIKTTDAKIEDIRSGIQKSQQKDHEQKDELKRLVSVAASLEECRATNAACRRALAKTYLVIAIEWKQRCDVDLYVTDPQGHKFYYAQKTFPGSEGELSFDMLDGPGIELWQNPAALQGDYLVKADRCPATVSGWVIDRAKGMQPLPKSPSSTWIVKLGSEGAATMQPAN